MMEYRRGMIRRIKAPGFRKRRLMRPIPQTSLSTPALSPKGKGGMKGIFFSITQLKANFNPNFGMFLNLG
jgi:hypothetical protein